MARNDELDEVEREEDEKDEQDRVEGNLEELGVSDKKQSKVLTEIMKKNPGLDANEALALAASRHSDLFGERGASGFDPNMHGSLRPKPGAQPPQPRLSEHAARMSYAKALVKAGHRHAGEEAARDVIAMAAAKALGWDYKPSQATPERFYVRE